MGTVNRTVETDYDKSQALKLIESRPTPFTLSVTDGKHRSTAQNKLQMLWMNEISQQLGDQTPEEVRGYCKLTIGVPILKASNAAFAKEYDKVVKPLPYPQKLKLMMVPFDFGVTRLMTTAQKSDYLDGIIRHFGEQGIVLTMPEDMRLPHNEASGLPSPERPDEGDTPAPAMAPAHAEVSPEPVASTPSQATGSSNFGKFDFSEGELQHLKDFARKALDDAAGDSDAPAKEAAVERLFMSYREVIESEDGKSVLNAMGVPIAAVVNGKRSREMAAEYIARELLGCSAAELEKIRHG